MPKPEDFNINFECRLTANNEIGSYSLIGKRSNPYPLHKLADPAFEILAQAITSSLLSNARLHALENKSFLPVDTPVPGDGPYLRQLANLIEAGRVILSVDKWVMADGTTKVLLTIDPTKGA